MIIGVLAVVLIGIYLLVNNFNNNETDSDKLTETEEELYEEELGEDYSDEASVLVSYKYIGAENLEDRDVLTLTKFDDDGEVTITAIAATDREKKTVTVPVGEYMLTSNYLQEEYFEIENQDQRVYITCDYNEGKFTIDISDDS